MQTQFCFREQNLHQYKQRLEIKAKSHMIIYLTQQNKGAQYLQSETIILYSDICCFQKQLVNNLHLNIPLFLMGTVDIKVQLAFPTPSPTKTLITSDFKLQYSDLGGHVTACI